MLQYIHAGHFETSELHCPLIFIVIYLLRYILDLPFLYYVGSFCLIVCVLLCALSKELLSKITVPSPVTIKILKF